MPWVTMTQDEVKSVQVGQKIKVNGVETSVTAIYDRSKGDYGFANKHKTFVKDAATELGRRLFSFLPDSCFEHEIVGCEGVVTYFNQNTFEKYQE